MMNRLCVSVNVLIILLKLNEVFSIFRYRNVFRSFLVFVCRVFCVLFSRLFSILISRKVKRF